MECKVSETTRRLSRALILLFFFSGDVELKWEGRCAPHTRPPRAYLSAPKTAQFLIGDCFRLRQIQFLRLPSTQTYPGADLMVLNARYRTTVTVGRLSWQMPQPIPRIVRSTDAPLNSPTEGHAHRKGGRDVQSMFSHIFKPDWFPEELTYVVQSNIPSIVTIWKVNVNNGVQTISIQTHSPSCQTFFAFWTSEVYMQLYFFYKKSRPQTIPAFPE